MGNNTQKPSHIVQYDETVTLLGHAEVRSPHLQTLVDSPAPLIWADGGANTALEFGLTPALIVGDMDSVSGRFDGEIIHLPEQETTDFEKCLYSVSTGFEN